jgi:cyclophilin family peptidyl-prolyl cis-trans isomerase
VEFQLQFPEENLDDLYSLTVDLEGESMPHSVLTFLSQVDEGLYNTGGFAFHHNAIHIVFGSPISNHLNKNELETWTSFETSGLSRLIFQEYSPEVPHVEYTIGFSERGPNIYFNTRDNTQNHGSIRDPCFGKVEKGREIIDRMHAASGELEEDDWKELQPGFVAVRSIAIL